MLRLTHFLHYSKGAMGSGKRQSKQKGLSALHSVFFLQKSFRQKHWVLCRFLSYYNQLLHVSYGTDRFYGSVLVRYEVVYKIRGGREVKSY